MTVGYAACCDADGVSVSHISYRGLLDRGTARMVIFYLLGPHHTFKLDISLVGWRHCFDIPAQSPCQQHAGQPERDSTLETVRLFAVLSFLNQEGGSKHLTRCCGTIWGKIASFDISLASLCRVAIRVTGATPCDKYVESCMSAVARRARKFSNMKGSGIKTW